MHLATESGKADVDPWCLGQSHQSWPGLSVAEAALPFCFQRMHWSVSQDWQLLVQTLSQTRKAVG